MSRMMFKTNERVEEPALTIADILIGPASFWDKLGIGDRTLEDYCCKECLYEKRYGPLAVFYHKGVCCAIHGQCVKVRRSELFNYGLITEFRRYEEEIRERIKMAQVKTGQEIVKYVDTHQLVSREQSLELKNRILYSMSGVKAEWGLLAEPAASALAQVALAFDLNTNNGEIMLIPIKRSQKIVDFTVYVGYKGHQRAAHRVARKELGTDFVFNENAMKVLTPQEVESRLAHYCSSCNGKGKFSGGGDCYACNGKGKFDPSEVRVVQIPLVVLAKAAQAGAAGLKPEDTWIWGTGTWRPGNNIMEGRDPQWTAEKRARVDALRKEFDLPFTTGEDEGANISHFEQAEDGTTQAVSKSGQPKDEVIDVKAMTVADIANAAGLAFDDEKALETVVEQALQAGFESMAHTIDTMVGELRVKEFKADEAESVLNQLVNFITGGEGQNVEEGFMDQPDGKTRHDAQEAIEKNGYKGPAFRALLVSLCGEGKNIGNCNAGELHNATRYAELVHQMQETGTSPALPKILSFSALDEGAKDLDDFKDTLKSIVKVCNKAGKSL